MMELGSPSKALCLGGSWNNADAMVIYGLFFFFFASVLGDKRLKTLNKLKLSNQIRRKRQRKELRIKA